MSVIANFLLYSLMFYLAGGALALLIMTYRCRKLWAGRGKNVQKVAFRKMIIVSFVVSWIYVIDVMCYVVDNFINKQNDDKQN